MRVARITLLSRVACREVAATRESAQAPQRRARAHRPVFDRTRALCSRLKQAMWIPSLSKEL